MDRRDAVSETQTATRQYAKRQMTWFRREPDVIWFEGFGDDAAIQQQVLDWVEGVIRLESVDGRHDNPPR